MAQTALQNCEICNQAPARDFCEECEQIFSINCKTMHLRIKLSRNHTFSEKGEVKLSLCIEHNSEYIAYCETCDFPTCKMCIFKTHKGHAMAEISDIIPRKKKEFSVKTKKYGKFLNYVRASRNLVEKRIALYNMETDKTVNDIEKEGENLKGAIDKYISAMISEIRKSQLTQQHEVESVTKLSEEIEGNGALLKKSADDVLKNKHGAEMLISLQELQCEMKITKLTSPEIVKIT